MRVKFLEDLPYLFLEIFLCELKLKKICAVIFFLSILLSEVITFQSHDKVLPQQFTTFCVLYDQEERMQLAEISWSFWVMSAESKVHQSTGQPLQNQTTYQ